MADDMTIPPGFVVDAKGNLIAEKNVKPTDLLMDQAVRSIVGHAENLSSQIGRFKAHTMDDIEAFLTTIREEYGAKRSRGAKGNISLTTIDGLMKVSERSDDVIAIGPELQVAKELLDELIDEWGEGASIQIQTLVQGAFETSKQGSVNRDALLRLRRLEFEHPKWPAVQQAIADCMRSVGRKSRIEIHTRDKPDGQWKLVPLNVANAGE